MYGFHGEVGGWESMLHGAQALLLHRGIVNERDTLARFKEEFYDTELFYDPFTGGKFAHYFFDAAERAGKGYDAETAHYLVEEAQLFIEACHSCYQKLLEACAPVKVTV